jgi:hypothetical protein
MTWAGRLPADMEARRNAKTVYAIGSHSVEISGNKGRWTATVDGEPLDNWFMSSADAWTAGVLEADSKDAGVATQSSMRHGFGGQVTGRSTETRIGRD